MMASNAALIQRSNEIAHEQRDAEQRTGYVIKLTKSGAYVKAARTYTIDPSAAMRFDFMTTALLVAFELLELAPEDFDVECVA